MYRFPTKENAKARAVETVARINKLRGEGKTMSEIAMILNYSEGYCYTLMRAHEELMKKQDTKSEVPGSPLKDKVPFYQVDDIGLVTYLYMNHVMPTKFGFRPGTTRIEFEYSELDQDSDVIARLIDSFYEGTHGNMYEYSRANRYIYSLVKRFNQGEKVTF